MNYYLAEAAENTFLLYDCLDVAFLESSFLESARQCLEEEDRDDVLILVEGKMQEDCFYAQMVVLGLDGNLGEFCGNGSRACAAYLCAKYPRVKNFFLKTEKGLRPLFNDGEGIYSIKMPKVSFEANEKFVTDFKGLKTLGHFHYAEILEPHLVLHEKLSDEELLLLGKKLNQMKTLFPHGINVNACYLMQDGSLYVRTYERGVQRLTQSCGTGSICCAAFYKTQGIVNVITPGGPLEIGLEQEGVMLKGPASFSYNNKKEEEG